MIEATIQRNGRTLKEVRSDVGKLLFIKTRKGYEFKCPRSKQIYLVPYEQMILEYLTMGDEQKSIHDKNISEAGDHKSRAHKMKGGQKA